LQRRRDLVAALGTLNNFTPPLQPYQGQRGCAGEILGARKLYVEGVKREKIGARWLGVKRTVKNRSGSRRRTILAREDMACLLACATGAKQAGLLDAHVREP